MRITIDIGSAKQTAENFAKKSSNVNAAIKVIIKKSIFVIEKYAKYYSPVKTGRMRASIGVSGYNIDGQFDTGEKSVDIADTYGTIMPTVTYAKYVHRRTPFMSAAAQDSLAEIEQIAKSEIEKALD